MTRPNHSPPRLRPRTRFGARRRVTARREPAPPAWRPAAARPRWSTRPPERSPLGFPAWFLGSVLGHVLLALALYFWPDPRKPQDQLPPPSFDVVFEGGQPQQAEADPTEGVPTEPVPPEPPSTADVPPPPDAPPQPGLPPPPQPSLPQPPAPPPPSPAQLALPQPPLPPPTPRIPQDVPLPPAALPPMEPAPMPQMQGTVELFAPQTEIRLPDRLSESLPPPPPPPPPPAPPQPQPQQRPTPPAQQAQPPRPSLPGIWAPGGVQLGRPQTPPAGRQQSRGLDLRVDPRMMEGRATRDPSVRVTGANVGADWRAAFRRWLDQNIHYSQQAIMRGEDGQVRVRITAAADGTVRNVQLVGPSTSPSLNFGTTYPFNGARLPTFPPGSDPNVVIDLTVNYVLIRGR
ncbi:TonB family protein [Roseococcus sp. SYP-B2431]|uniref:TonB family protein n=1 Tax=Roseococcus sp. SYP-B2431 TaxID=2496640 RepID=UPI00197F4FE1|nr:TonB family protein [Roseococcus sp. SYP-B2431]